jgi:prepilin-type N-terminal cleavage/methylation domain-containing protein
MKRLHRDERGLTMIELLVAMVLASIVLTGVVNMFVSGTRAGADANARMNSQQDVRLALDKLEFEGRCATSAGLISSGQGVAFSIPSWCSHASGAVTWCIVGGALTRYTSNSCTGTGRTYVSGVTTRPFSIRPPLRKAMPQPLSMISVNSSAGSIDGGDVDDSITLRNASRAPWRHPADRPAVNAALAALLRFSPRSSFMNVTAARRRKAARWEFRPPACTATARSAPITSRWSRTCRRAAAVGTAAPRSVGATR